LATAPILFIIFNRPSTTQQVFEAIRAIRPSRLYIAADAPRVGRTGDIEKCKATRIVTEHIDWPCTVKRLYRTENLGCGLAVSGAINWFFSFEEAGIILEDDCLPHPDFFEFASTMLERYKENSRIISINGSNLGYQIQNGESYCFSRYMNMWGWATWADRAKEIDYSLKSWKSIKNPLFFLYRHMRQHFFDTDINWYKYWKEKFDLTVNNEIITWWDWQWIYHQLTHHKLSIVPAVNLVTNIGFNADATHTHLANNPAANILTQPIHLPLRHPAQLEPDYLYEEHYVKWVWCYHKRLPTMFYIKQFISRFIGRG
jgi:hypothetical protein